MSVTLAAGGPCIEFVMTLLASILKSWAADPAFSYQPRRGPVGLAALVPAPPAGRRTV